MNYNQGSNLLKLNKVSLAASVGMDYLLQDISFTVNKGEKIAIVGASGSGKTSLLRLLNSLVNPVDGELFFAGKSYRTYHKIDLRKQIMLVPQEPKLLGMTVKEALKYPLKLQQSSKQQITERLFKYCEMLQIPQEWLERSELKLSLGQKQLITIVRALMLEPKILLLDEPTSALDLGKSDRLLEVLDRLNQNPNITILMVNHQLELIQNFVDRILYIAKGKLLLDIPATSDNWEQTKYELKQEDRQISQQWQ